MDVDNSPAGGAKPPPLNSDQLNYLIWRYLQESGYAEAAVKLQRDWRVDAEDLPFAKHIKGQALVSLVQKGLRYHHLSLTIDDNGRPSRQLAPSMFYFGPESEKQPPPIREPTQLAEGDARVPSPAESPVPPRKHPRDAVINGAVDTTSQPAPKKSRKSNNAVTAERNGVNGRKARSSSINNGTTSAMEVDAINGHPVSMSDARSPSVTEAGIEDNGIIVNGIIPEERMDVDTDGEQPQQEEAVPPPIIPTLIHGESVGIQVAPAKVANLSPTSTILQIPEMKHVTTAVWLPGDPNRLTAAGDYLCGSWKLSGTGTQLNGKSHVFQDLLEHQANTLVSAIAWEPSGSMLAVATYANQSGQIHLYDGQNLGLLETLPASQRAITCLQWQKTGLKLVGVAPYDEQGSLSDTASTILLWDLSSNQSPASPLSISVPETLLAIDCATQLDQGIVCVAGDKAVYCCRAFSQLEVEQKWTSTYDEDDNWMFVRCAWGGAQTPFLVAASGESGRLWLPRLGLSKHEAHTAAITGLELRSRAPVGSDPAVFEFATSSIDGLLKVWLCDEGSASVQLLSKLAIGQGSPLMTLAYSPDGFCLAGASYSQIRIWNAEHGYNHMANWEGSSEEWKGVTLKDEDLMSTGGTSSLNGEAAQMSMVHSMSWDVDSKRLAFALASQIALIDFQR